MKVLLDTHVLIWAMLSPRQLSKKAKVTVEDRSNTILVSVASAWEIATKVRSGKLPGAEVFEREFMELEERTGYVMVPIATTVALRAGRLVGEHRDPFDRMIAAQALELDIAVVSSDEKLDEFGVQRIW